MKIVMDLIGFVACDAGIVILPLSATEMKEDLAKVALFHLVKALKFIMAELHFQVMLVN